MIDCQPMLAGDGTREVGGGIEVAHVRRSLARRYTHWIKMVEQPEGS